MAGKRSALGTSTVLLPLFVLRLAKSTGNPATWWEQELHGLFELTSGIFHEEVLEAADSQDLRERLDRIARSEKWLHICALLTNLVMKAGEEELASALEWEPPSLGLNTLPEAQELLSEGLSFVRAQWDMLSAVTREDPALASYVEKTLAGPGNLGTLLAAMERLLPVPVAHAIETQLRGPAAFMALAVSQTDDGHHPAWLGLELVKQFRDGAYESLRFAASFGLASVPETLVPASDRYDLHELLSKVKDNPAQAVGQAYAQGRLSLDEVAAILDRDRADVGFWLDEHGFSRPIDAITLTPAAREAAVRQLDEHRRTRPVPPGMNREAVRREVISTQRLEDLDARPWMNSPKA